MIEQETRWRVYTLPRSNDEVQFELFLVVASTATDVLAAIELAAANAGMLIERVPE